MNQSCVVTPGHRNPTPPHNHPVLVKDKHRNTQVKFRCKTKKKFPDVGKTTADLPKQAKDAVSELFRQIITLPTWGQGHGRTGIQCFVCLHLPEGGKTPVRSRSVHVCSG